MKKGQKRATGRVPGPEGRHAGGWRHGLNQDGGDGRMDQDHEKNQDGEDERMGQDRKGRT
ncbi:hypothetical protein [Sphingobacterium sp.]|uniref:hypothetical protein n=1 Tax=Sphingobacterium sp. TaxID=341027 RepID=UPI0028AF4F97|nr:hypothetical protein [Sphingobacterium sp.]